MNYDTIGTKIRFYRKKKHLTQASLANQVTCSAKHLGNIERGLARPSLECLYEIALALNVSMDFLLASTVDYTSKSCNPDSLLPQASLSNDIPFEIKNKIDDFITLQQAALLHLQEEVHALSKNVSDRSQ